MPPIPQIIHILRSKFGFSLQEATEFIDDMGEPLKTNLLNYKTEDLENFLRKYHIFWNYDNMLFTYQLYLDKLQLDENKFYGNILDIGSAYGYFIAFAKRKSAFAGSRIVGIDYNKNFVKRGQKQGLEIYHMNALDLDFPDESFDLAISSFALPLMLNMLGEDVFGQNTQKWLIETLIVLKKGGELRFVCPGKHAHKDGEIVENILKSFEKNCQKVSITKIDEHNSLHILQK